jgi:hypothetical protein
MKTKVRMLTTTQGREDGRVQWFIENGVYEISDELLQSFIDQGLVDLHDIELRETKVIIPDEPRQKRKYTRKNA